MITQPANSGSRLEPVVRAVVRDSGFELEDLEEVSAGRRRLLRVVIDSAVGVRLDDITAVSRALAGVLDERDELVTGPYTLEVTSPGLDRPLTKPRHWRRNRLRRVRVTLAGGEELTGRIGDSDDEGVTLLVAGTLRRVRYAMVHRAVVEVEFRDPPAAEVAALEDLPGQDPTGQDPTGQDPTGQDLEER